MNGMCFSAVLSCWIRGVREAVFCIQPQSHARDFNFCIIRDAILLASTTVHNDFGQLNQTLVVSLSPDNLEKMKSDANVEWFEGDGRVIYCSIR